MPRVSLPLKTCTVAAVAGLLAIVFLTTAGPLSAQGHAVELAVSMLSEDARASATVLQNQDGDWVTLQEGSGAFVCLADTSGDDRFSATCYHRALDAYMARGRELASQGVDRGENIQTRIAEIAAGTLKLPALGTLIQINGPADWSGDAATANRRTVLYVPGATAEDVGLPTSRADGPWFMSGPVAHIMISG